MAISGRKIEVWDVSGTPARYLAGREDTITVNGELIDITSKSSDGWRELLADIAIRSIDVSGSGIMDSAAIIAKALGPTSALLADSEIRIEDWGVIEGAFAFESPEISSPYDGLVECSYTLKSSGVITWTAA